MAWSLVINHGTSHAGEVTEDVQRTYVFLVASVPRGRRIVNSLAIDLFKGRAKDAKDFGPGTIFQQHDVAATLSARITRVPDVILKTTAEAVRVL